MVLKTTLNWKKWFWGNNGQLCCFWQSVYIDLECLKFCLVHVGNECKRWSFGRSNLECSLGIWTNSGIKKMLIIHFKNSFLSKNIFHLRSNSSEGANFQGLFKLGTFGNWSTFEVWSISTIIWSFFSGFRLVEKWNSGFSSGAIEKFG